MPPIPRTPAVDIEGAAEYLGISVRHMRRLVADRRIAHFKVGHLIRFRYDDLDAFLQAGRREAVCLR